MRHRGDGGACRERCQRLSLRRRACLALLLLALLLVGCRGASADMMRPARYDAPLPKGGSVFFVGNSFFGWEGRYLPEWVAALGKATGTTFRVGGDIVPGDQPLATFLHHKAVEAALASGEYRVWVIQAYELEPVNHPEGFKQAIRDFNKAVAAAGGRVVLFMTWEFPWRRCLPQLSAAYESIGQELGLPIIPAGLIYRDCGDSPPEGEGTFFLTASPERPGGDLHENVFGAAVNTYATYSILTGRNPHGQTFVAPGNDIGAGMLGYLSDRSWSRIAPRLRNEGTSGVEIPGSRAIVIPFLREGDTENARGDEHKSP
jgi:hypothetical protein